MPRYLPNKAVIPTLARHVSVEQFLGVREDAGHRRVRWVEVRPVHACYEVHVIEVEDRGGADWADVYAWIDGDAEMMEFRFPTPAQAIEFTVERWATRPDRWMNQGLVQDEYLDVVRADI